MVTKWYIEFLPVLFSQPRGILVDNLTMTSDLADTLINRPWAEVTKWVESVADQR